MAVRNPIAKALEAAGAGTVIELMPGDYPAFSMGFSKANDWNARTSGGTPGRPITVRAVGKVRIFSADASEAISIGHELGTRHVTFEGLVIVPGYRAGVFFFRLPPGKAHEGFRFLDCSIEGGYDHSAGSGPRSKWGVYGHGLKDFEFRGVRGRARVVDIQQEHGFYLQNPMGDMTLENIDAARLGRTFLQLTARSSEGPAGIGTIRVRNCRVEDVCIASGDNYKGGSAFTVAGRLMGPVIFESNTYRAGFNPALRKLTNQGQPYGTGAFVAWAGGGEINGKVVLIKNRFEMAPDCGDRPLVSVGGCTEVVLEAGNHFVAGKHRSALEIDPLNEEGAQAQPLIKSVRIHPQNHFEGEVRKSGRVLDAAALLELAGG